MTGFEISILDFIQNTLRCDFLDFLMPKITALGNAGIFWIILVVIFLISKKHKKTGIIMAAALIINLVLCNIILKPMIARTRPFDVNTAITLLISRPTDFSFPSGHSSASFAAAMAMYYSKDKYWKIAMVLAFMIAFSRLYLYVHFPTDVICGSLLGILCGYLGDKFSRKFIFK